MLCIVRIRKFERGLWFRHGDFVGLLGTGKYRFWSRLWSDVWDEIRIVNTLATRFEHPLLDVLIKDEHLWDALQIVDLTDNERALIWKDGRLAYIVGPGRHAFWREPAEIRVETFDVNEFRFTHDKIEAVAAHPEASKHFIGLEVEAHEDALLFRNGELADKLGQGKYLFWKGAGRITWKAVDRREQVADVAGQEIMTNDKVTLRVNLIVTHQVIDPVKAVTVVSDYVQALYREAQLVLRAAVGTRALDALLSDKEAVGSEVRDALTKRAGEFGLVIRSVGLRDIILPGDMKAILNEVIAAEKQAQANLIKRREETAAARSQANTARLLAENPTLARIKELEMLQEVLAGTKATFVLGPTDIADQVRGLITKGANYDA
ncbi:MAG: slipin family protein [Phycisphaerales bacterium]|nr:MAG: slipin family protein [Phycisphaerales bacterium]